MSHLKQTKVGETKYKTPGKWTLSTSEQSQLSKALFSRLLRPRSVEESVSSPPPSQTPLYRGYHWDLSLIPTLPVKGPLYPSPQDPSIVFRQRYKTYKHTEVISTTLIYGLCCHNATPRKSGTLESGTSTLITRIFSRTPRSSGESREDETLLCRK